MLVLRIVEAFHFRFDTDESQHLHVVWGWATGHLQYRDVFDNHGPIFHLLCVPLFRLLGVRPDILIPMRLAVLPLFAICLWCTYRLGTSVFSKNVGCWAAILTGFYPEFFLTTTEFRTDDLWTTLWLLALVVATRFSWKAKDAFLSGLLLGAAFAVTVKTGLMLGALVASTGLILGWQWLGGKKRSLGMLFRWAAAGLAGLAIVPGVVILAFVAGGMGERLLYCNVLHNLVPHTQNWARFDEHLLWFPIFALVVLGALPFLKRYRFDSVAVRRIWFILTTGFYFTALKSFFPTLTRQDDLPVIPLAFVLLVAGIFELSRFLAPRWQSSLALRLLFPVLVTIEIAALILKAPFWKNETKQDIAAVADVLRATEPNDFVMDATGETMFRMRPYYYALEAFTKARIERGLIVDDIPERLIATQTTLVRPRDLTESSRDFVSDNYLPVGNGLWMSGKRLNFYRKTANPSLSFDVVVPTSYTILTSTGKVVAGDLDGSPLTGPRFLDAGKHTFVPSGIESGRFSLFCAKGFERGFLPPSKR